MNQYVQLLPHSEVTLEHSLLPLPPYPSAKHPQVKLDPQVCFTCVCLYATTPLQWFALVAYCFVSWISNLSNICKNCCHNAYYRKMCNAICVFVHMHDICKCMHVCSTIRTRKQRPLGLTIFTNVLNKTPHLKCKAFVTKQAH